MMILTSRLYEEARHHAAVFALDVLDGKHKEWFEGAEPCEWAVSWVAAHLRDGWAHMLNDDCPPRPSPHEAETILAITRRTLTETFEAARPADLSETRP